MLRDGDSPTLVCEVIMAQADVFHCSYGKMAKLSIFFSGSKLHFLKRMTA
jgi:hypothetical protein